MFWMPFNDFSEVFTTFWICPVTLPCVRNSSCGRPACDHEGCGRAAAPRFRKCCRGCPTSHDAACDARGTATARLPRCSFCRQPLNRRWVLLSDGSWHRLKRGSVCFVCLRSTSHGKPQMQLEGVHTIQSVVPPAPPQKLKTCRYLSC